MNIKVKILKFGDFMKSVIAAVIVMMLVIGCGGGSGGSEQPAPAQKELIKVEAPAAIPVPERKTPTSDTDWEAKVHNKNIEVIEVVNILNPVAAYLAEGFKLYGPKFSPTLQEEWVDTQELLGRALGMWDESKKKMEAGKADKALFLELEETWQLLVKTGVAGMRTKAMVDAEAAKIAG